MIEIFSWKIPNIVHLEYNWLLGFYYWIIENKVNKINYWNISENVILCINKWDDNSMIRTNCCGQEDPNIVYAIIDYIR